MFLEKCGQLFFSKMRLPFLLLLILTPLIVAGFFLSSEMTNLQELEERFASASRKKRLADKRKDLKNRFFTRYANAEPYFLDKNIEAFPLLQRERKNLEVLSLHPAFSESRSIQEQIAFIENNKLSFSEEQISESKEMRETEEKQRNIVFMDESDLKQLLFLIEDVPNRSDELTSRPQILIKKLQLKKQKSPFQTEYFAVEMDLLKREFTQ